MLLFLEIHTANAQHVSEKRLSSIYHLSLSIIYLPIYLVYLPIITYRLSSHLEKKIINQMGKLEGIDLSQ